MKIGIDAREFRAGRMTGIGRYLWQFLEYALAKGDSPLFLNPPHSPFKKGGERGISHEFILFCNQDTWIPIEHPRIKKIVVPEYLTVLWDQAFLPLYAAREKLDVFLTPYFKAPIFLSCKTVLIINDVIPLLFPEENSLISRIYFETFCAISAKNAHKIIAISQHSKNDILKFFKLDPDKVEVVHLGVEEKYKPMSLINQATTSAINRTATNEIRKRYGIPYKYILYVGNLSPHKNVEGLIKSYARLPINLKEEYKLVLGVSKSDRYYPKIENLIEELELSKDIIITGFIIEEHLPLIYGASSLFVFPSFYEGFGLPPLEAMICGVPVIASNASSIPEVVDDAALLVGPEDVEGISSAIVRVLTDENLRKSMIEKGLERAKEFTPERMTDGFLKVIEEAGINK